MKTSLAPPRNSILITMTVIDEHGNETIQRHMATTMLEVSFGNTLERRAEDMAREFKMVYLDSLMRGGK